MQENISSWSS